MFRFRDIVVDLYTVVVDLYTVSNVTFWIHMMAHPFALISAVQSVSCKYYRINAVLRVSGVGTQRAEVRRVTSWRKAVNLQLVTL